MQKYDLMGNAGSPHAQKTGAASFGCGGRLPHKNKTTDRSVRNNRRKIHVLEARLELARTFLPKGF